MGIEHFVVTYPIEKNMHHWSPKKIPAISHVNPKSQYVPVISTQLLR